MKRSKKTWSGGFIRMSINRGRAAFKEGSGNGSSFLIISAFLITSTFLFHPDSHPTLVNCFKFSTFFPNFFYHLVVSNLEESTLVFRTIRLNLQSWMIEDDGWNKTMKYFVKMAFPFLTFARCARSRNQSIATFHPRLSYPPFWTSTKLKPRRAPKWATVTPATRSLKS